MKPRIPLLAGSTIIGLLLLAACSNSGGAALQLPKTPTFDAAFDDPDDSGIFGLAFLMADLDTATLSLEALPSSELSTTALTEVTPGLYLGNLIDIDGDGITLTLPAAEEIPDSTMAPVEAAFYNPDQFTDCSVSAEPNSVEVSYNAFAIYINIPGFIGITAEGITGVAVTDQPIDISADIPNGTHFLYWVYSDGATSFSFEGTGCGTFVAEDVTLTEGWNTLAWKYEDDGTDVTATLVNYDEPEEVFVTGLGLP